MTVPTELKYTDSHEWVRLDPDGSVTVGITHHAQDRLGDLGLCGEPGRGQALQEGPGMRRSRIGEGRLGHLCADLGRGGRDNEALSGNPEKINQDAYAAWMFKLKPSDPGGAGLAAGCGGRTRS